RLALVSREGAGDVWTYDLSRGSLTRFTFDEGEDETPVWSPDGKRVAFSSTLSDQPRTILLKNADVT
ncbi:MAG: TolB family protein, partial [Terriglobales bacterium]